MAGRFVGQIGLTNVGRFNDPGGVLPDAPPGPISADLSATEADNTLVSTALNVVPDIATPIVELFGEDDQFDAGLFDPAPLESAATVISGTASITEADDTLASTAVLIIKAAAAITEQDDTGSETAVLIIKAACLMTEADDTLSSIATLKIQATAAVTEADDTVTSAAALVIQATASITEADDTLSANGGAQAFEVSAVIIELFGEDDEATFGFADPAPLDSAGIVATAAITEADDTLAAASTLKLQATASITEQDDTGSETAVLLIQATALITEADDTLSATGGVAGAISAVLNVTEADDTLAADSHNDSQIPGGVGPNTPPNTGRYANRRQGIGRGRSLEDILNEVRPIHATAKITEADDTLAATAQVRPLSPSISAEDRAEQVAALVALTIQQYEDEEAAALLLLLAA